MKDDTDIPGRGSDQGSVATSNGTTRRQFLKTTTAVVAGATLAPTGSMLFSRSAYAAIPYTGLDVPRPLDPSFIFTSRGGSSPVYSVFAAETSQDLGLGGSTTVWGYGNASDPSQTATYPGRTFFVEAKKPIKVRWENNLPMSNAAVYPIVSSDQEDVTSVLDKTLHWADPAMGRPPGNTIEEVGPPIVTHLHGGQNLSNFDGLPEYWFTPNQAVKGPLYKTNQYNYPIDPEASTLWYHDHALGITRLNVYAGLAGFFIITDDNNEALIEQGVLPRGVDNKYDIPLVIQDREFTGTQLSLPTTTEPNTAAYNTAWEDAVTNTPALQDPPFDFSPADPQLMEFPSGPSNQAEFFGDTILVNGILWPTLSVEPTKYRLRLLNGSDSRFYKLGLRDAQTGAGTPVPFYVIATDQGFVNNGPVLIDTELLIAPGERYEIIVDFSLLSGETLFLRNFGPDEPFRGSGQAPADEGSTGQILQIDVTASFTVDSAPEWSSTAPLRPGPYVVGPEARTRKVALFEGLDEYARLQPILGGEYTDPDGNAALRSFGWTQPITENPGVNDIELWEIHNFTEDAHPIHLHLVAFEVVDRQAFTLSGAGVVPIIQQQHDGSYGIGGKVLESAIISGASRDPAEDYENGPKDTVIALPGEITRIRMKFTKPGRYVWHCHILSHEDHEMMRPYQVGPVPGSSPEKPETLPPQ